MFPSYTKAIFNQVNKDGKVRLYKPLKTLIHYPQEKIPVLECFPDCVNVNREKKQSI